MSFSPVGDHAAQIVLGIIERQQGEQINAANKIIAEQNAVIARAHAALSWAFENLTIESPANSSILGLKKIAEALAEIEGRK